MSNPSSSSPATVSRTSRGPRGATRTTDTRRNGGGARRLRRALTGTSVGAVTVIARMGDDGAMGELRDLLVSTAARVADHREGGPERPVFPNRADIDAA